MTLLAKIVALFPVFIGVQGLKHKLILFIGDFFYKNTKKETFTYRNTTLNLDKQNRFSRLLLYATHNYFNYFNATDLGHYIQNNVSKSDTFIDVGANLGGYSFLAKNKGCEVHCFEPVKELYNILNNNPQAFGKAYALALSNQNGKGQFYVSEHVEGSSLVLGKGENASAHTHKVTEIDLATFDSVFREQIKTNQPIALVKIDVEGNEEKVVKGMDKALEKHVIKAIWCEVRGPSSDRNPNSYLAVCEHLTNAGYEAFTYKNGQRLPFNAKTETNVPQYFDLLFLLKKQDNLMESPS